MTTRRHVFMRYKLKRDSSDTPPDRPDTSSGPKNQPPHNYPAQKARQAEVALNRPWKRRTFFVCLVLAVIAASVIGASML